MQASHYRTIKSGAKYANLFPKAGGEEIIIKKGAEVSDTLKFAPKVVYDTLSDTKELSKLLKGKSLYETCHNIWDFVYNHIQYHHDEEGVEQVRRPARTWMDRVRGVDCDCYTVFISSILTNLSIPHIYRITKYKHKNNFQHIYPIVPTTDGKYITIDAVVTKFNYEEPFTEKKDTPMNLSYLNGIDTEEEENSLMAVSPNSDIRDLPDFQDFDGLGKIKIGNVLKSVAHVANKANPAAVLLRLGVLASMKLNLFQIPKNLKYAYMTDAQVKEQDLDVKKIAKLRKVLKKMEDVFYGAGGDKKNLKKSMLSGRGNKKHDVKGLGDYDIDTPLRELLSGIYDEEFTDAVKELNGLGDPATGTAIAAATTVLAAIAAVIKGIGGVKKAISPKASGTVAPTVDANGNPIPLPDDTDGTTNLTATNTNTRKRAKIAATTTPPNDDDDTAPPDVKQANTNLNLIAKKANMQLTKTDAAAAALTTTTTPPTSFMDTAKAWIEDNPKTTAVIGVGIAAVIVFGVFELHKHHHKAHPASTPALSGIPKTRKKRRGKKHKKSAIALL